MTDMVKYSGYFSIKVFNNSYSFFFCQNEVQIENIKMIQSFIGLGGLILKIGGKTDNL